MNLDVFNSLFHRDFNPDETWKDMICFLQASYAGSLDKRPFVLGLSGGIDSALVATMVTLAGIPLHVMMLPDGLDPLKKSIIFAWNMIDYLKIPTSNVHVFDIGPMLDLRCDHCHSQPYPECGKLTCRGNRAARSRMTELYALAAEVGGVVCGTENLTEYHLGYFTLHGDAASDIEPIHGLFKTEVWNMARYFSLPEDIVSQAPSAELWANQTDEGELGFSYSVADAVIKTHASFSWLTQLEISQEEAEKVIRRIEGTDFKRRSKPVWNFPGRNDFIPV